MESVDNHLLKALVTRLYKGFCNPPPKNVMYGTSHMFFFRSDMVIVRMSFAMLFMYEMYLYSRWSDRCGSLIQVKAKTTAEGVQDSAAREGYLKHRSF